MPINYVAGSGGIIATYAQVITGIASIGIAFVAMRMSTKTARQQNLAAIAANRPFIYAEPSAASLLVGDAGQSVQWQIKNYGPGPAINVKASQHQYLAGKDEAGRPFANPPASSAAGLFMVVNEQVALIGVGKNPCFLAQADVN